MGRVLHGDARSLTALYEERGAGDFKGRNAGAPLSELAVSRTCAPEAPQVVLNYELSQVVHAVAKEAVA